MPQHTQHSLIPVLLLWITVLSIVQVVFIVLFFTAGHHDLSQNSDTVAPERPLQFQANNTPAPPSNHGLPLGKGLMLTFKITEVSRSITLVPKNPHQGLVSEEGGTILKIKKDGYFFLNLRVTLLSCNACGSQHTVGLKLEDKCILQGGINKNTRSTGLGKVEVLPAGVTLEVIVNLPADAQIDEDNSHLDIIYMLKP